jgi:hypothetical protein
MLELTELQLLWIVTGMTFSQTFPFMKQWKCIVVVEEELRTFLQIATQDVHAATFIFNLFGNLHEMK